MGVFAKIDAGKFTRFIESIRESEEANKRHFELLQQLDLKDPKSIEMLGAIDRDMHRRAQMACIEDYAENLRKFPDSKEEHLSDIREAAAEDNLYLLEILIHASMALPLLDPRSDIFVLEYLVSFFRRSEDATKVRFAKYLFEQVLDTADNDLEEYVSIINSLFIMGKEPEWFEDFFWQVEKLIHRAPVGEGTLAAVKKGLTKTAGQAKLFIEEYILMKYGATQ